MRIEEFEKLAPDLRQQMLRIGQDFFGNQQDAEDVAQEGLIRLWTYCERLDASFTLSPLAIKVAKNICIDLYKSRRAETAELQTDIPAQPSYNADARLATQENLHRIESALDTSRRTRPSYSENAISRKKPTMRLYKKRAYP